MFAPDPFKQGKEVYRLLVFIWSNGPLEFIDASDALQPFRQYKYRDTRPQLPGLCHNGGGSRGHGSFYFLTY
ncbi:unnamed protein product, partial [Coregonus sp. 'balchen']